MIDLEILIQTLGTIGIHFFKILCTKHTLNEYEIKNIINIIQINLFKLKNFYKLNILQTTFLSFIFHLYRFFFIFMF